MTSGEKQDSKANLDPFESEGEIDCSVIYRLCFEFVLDFMIS